ncbi:MAG: hypothetical protein A2293_11915 [Elusimicrobia bacterium RIFOXYB2_FULL_49_7]|nr:MAG: hypothetical protein A2293_11915 [Elusimicrobia bacterium RIFOXYB2_FULL_49_7]
MTIMKTLIILLLLSPFVLSAPEDSLSQTASKPSLALTRTVSQASTAGGVRPVVRSNGAVFLGLESRVDNRFHETLEERIHDGLSNDRRLVLEDRGFYQHANERGLLQRKLLSLDETIAFSDRFGDRFYISGEIRSFRITLQRRLGFLPWGKVEGEIICFLQVFDVVEKKARFAGNLCFIGDMDAGYFGYGDLRSLMPLSSVEEKYFVDELQKGMTEVFLEKVDAALTGVLGRKRLKSRESAGGS